MTEAVQLRRRSSLATPHSYHVPALRTKPSGRFLVPHDVFLDLLMPKVLIGGREFASSTIMPVPETAVDEYYGAVFRQHNIRCAGKIVSMKPKSISQPMEQRANENLRPRIPVPDT